MTGRHVCPVGGCEREVPDHLLMCSADWHRVPPSLQRRVYAAYRRGEGLGTPELLEAQTAAIAAANAARNAAPAPVPLFGSSGQRARRGGYR
jgi:hypothetical protein